MDHAKLDLKRLLTDAAGFGFALWLIGFVLGMLFFVFVPVAIIGWFVLPLLIAATVFFSYKRFASSGLSLVYYAVVALGWVLIAIVFDYIFLVNAFKVQNYYDADVFLYYLSTFFIPLLTGLKFGNKNKS